MILQRRKSSFDIDLIFLFLQFVFVSSFFYAYYTYVSAVQYISSIHLYHLPYLDSLSFYSCPPLRSSPTLLSVALYRHTRLHSNASFFLQSSVPSSYNMRGARLLANFSVTFWDLQNLNLKHYEIQVFKFGILHLVIHHRDHFILWQRVIKDIHKHLGTLE